MNFLVFGAQSLGYALIYDLIRSPKVERIYLADPDADKIAAIMQHFVDERIVPCQLEVTNSDEVLSLMANATVVVSTLSHSYELSKLALQAGVNYVDCGINEEVMRSQFLLDELAKEAKIAMIPGCGLTPGMVSILAASATTGMDEIFGIHIRVGQLPLEGQGVHLISPMISAERFLSEATEDATIIRSGEVMRVPALSDLEYIENLGPFQKLEAFNAASGVSHFVRSMHDKVQVLDFKSIHREGFCDQVRALRELGLMDRESITVNSTPVSPRAVLATLLDKKIPKDEPDMVLIRITVTGTREKSDVQVTWECVDSVNQADGISAMTRLRAFPASIMAQLIARGDIADHGVFAPDQCLPTKIYLAELASRGIHVTMTEETFGADKIND
jgi:lysine 6-dehydrogenase